MTRKFIALQYMIFQVQFSAVEARCSTTYTKGGDFLIRHKFDKSLFAHEERLTVTAVK